MSKYNTIQFTSDALFKDKNSKFYSYAYPVTSINDVKDHLDKLKKEHHQARHFCFAYRFGLDGNNFRANDDGEPSGTAGKPILGQIDSFELTDVFIVVVRYFGGTKLGVSGLIQAYRAAAKMAIEKAKIIENELEDSFKLTCDYSDIPKLMDLLKNVSVEITEKQFEAKPTLWIAIPMSLTKQVIGHIKDLRTCTIEQLS